MVHGFRLALKQAALMQQAVLFQGFGRVGTPRPGNGYG